MRIQIPGTNITICDDDSEINKTIKRIRREVGIKHPNYQYPDSLLNNQDWVFVHIDPSSTIVGDVILFFIRYYAKAGDSGFLSFEINNFFANRKEIEVLFNIFENEDDGTSEKTLNILKDLKEMASFTQLARSGILSTPPPSLN